MGTSYAYVMHVLLLTTVLQQLYKSTCDSRHPSFTATCVYWWKL